jgi:4-amino-4-deoxy-L-arabinose transferase-like glycosyltransferase
MTSSSVPTLRRKWRGRAAEAVAVAAILILAALLRFWRLDAISFTYDAAAIGNLAARLVDAGQLPLQGMVSSTGIRNPPLGVILLGVPVLFSRDPAVLAGFVILLNVAGVYGTYWLGRRYWGPAVGLLAALLFAVSPWAVQHSRGILGQDMLIPGVVLLFVFLFAWLVDGKQWALSAGLVTAAALIQVHFAALAFAPVLAILILWQVLRCLRRHQPVPFWRHLAIGVGAGLLLYVPYLAGEAQNGWGDLRRLLDLSRQPYRWHGQALNLALMAVGGRNLHSLAGAPAYRQFLDQVIDPAYRLDRLEEVLVVIAFAYLVVRWVQRRANARLFARDALLLLWMAGPLLFFLVSKSDIFPHYFVVIYSAPYLALAAAAEDGLAALGAHRRLKRGFAVAGGLLIAAILVWQASLVVSIYDFIDFHNTPGGWGTPVRILRDVARTAGQLATLNGASKVVMLCPGSDPRWDECPAAFAFLTSRGPSVGFIDYNDPSFRLHQDDPETLVVLAPGDSLAADELPHLARELPAAVPLRENSGAYRFFEIRNPYRELASYIDATAEPGDAILLVGPDQRQALAEYYRGNLPIYELPAQPASAEATIQQLSDLARQHGRLYALYRSDEVSDPQGVVNDWLDKNAFASADQWIGPVRFTTYVAPDLGSAWPVQEPSAVFGDQFELRRAARPPGDVEAGGLLPIRLEWNSLARPGADYQLFAQLLDANGQVRAQRDVPLTDGERPTAAPGPYGMAGTGWQPGQEAATRLALTIPPGTPPAAYRLIVGLYNPVDGKRLATNGQDLLDLGAVTVKPSSASPSAALLGTRYRPNLSFPDVTLIGHDRYRKGFAYAPDTPLGPGDVLRLVYLWQSKAQPGTNWLVTSRLVDSGGRAVAEVTAPLADAAYPTSRWGPDEVVRGEHDLALPSTLKPGRYQLQINVHREDVRSAGRWLDLGPVVVQ